MTKKRAIGAVLIAAGLLAGCSAHPGTAAVVNGKEISEKSLEQMAQSIEVDTQGRRAVLLQWAVIAAITEPVLEAHSDLLTADAQTALLATCTEGFGIGEFNAETPETLKNYCYVATLSQQDPAIGEELSAAMEAAISNEKIELSPRYASTLAEFPGYEGPLSYVDARDRSLQALGLSPAVG
ncbi:MAG: hypothetical protein QM705_12675 [Ancrocorticia sp.]